MNGWNWSENRIDKSIYVWWTGIFDQGEAAVWVENRSWVDEAIVLKAKA